MKSYLALTSIIFFCINFSFGQISLGVGFNMPIGSYRSIEDGSANPGYQITTSWDKSIDENFGLSTGILVGQNTINENSIKYLNSSWSFSALELGLFFKPMDNLKIKGLFTTGIYGTPIIQGENGTFTLNKVSPGLDFRVNYSFKNKFIGTNFLYSNPNFGLPNGTEEQRITSLGLLFGFNF